MVHSFIMLDEDPALGPTFLSGFTGQQRATALLGISAYPPTINTSDHAELADRAAADVVGEAGIKRNMASLTAGEDFAYMLREAPGAFLLLGQADGNIGKASLHRGLYDFNDDLLPIGASCLVRLTELELPRG